MAFRVEISPRAMADLDAIAGHISRQGSFARAQSWFNEMIAAISSLKVIPRRCPVASEAELLGREVRVLLHGRRNHRYKVYFSVRGKTPSSGTVQVLHVRHWARRGVEAQEFEDFPGETPPGRSVRHRPV